MNRYMYLIMLFVVVIIEGCFFRSERKWMDCVPVQDQEAGNSIPVDTSISITWAAYNQVRIYEYNDRIKDSLYSYKRGGLTYRVRSGNSYKDFIAQHVKGSDVVVCLDKKDSVRWTDFRDGVYIFVQYKDIVRVLVEANYKNDSINAFIDSVHDMVPLTWMDKYNFYW